MTILNSGKQFIRILISICICISVFVVVSSIMAYSMLSMLFGKIKRNINTRKRLN